jgi:hypothetical protein
VGIDVSERTVSRLLLRRRRRPPSQTWRTFLTNHAATLGSMDFVTFPTKHRHVPDQTSMTRQLLKQRLGEIANDSSNKAKQLIAFQKFAVMVTRIRRAGKMVVTLFRFGPNAVVRAAIGLALSRLNKPTSGRNAMPRTRTVFDRFRSS